MSFLDKAKQAADQARSKAAQVAAERGDAIRSGLDKAGNAVDERTGGKYHEKITKARGAADARIDQLAGEHAAGTRTDPVSAEARIVTDDEVAGEGLRPPDVHERGERPGDVTPDAAHPPVGPEEADPDVVRARGSRLYGGTAPGGVSPEAPTPPGETPGGPAAGSSR